MLNTQQKRVRLLVIAIVGVFLLTLLLHIAAGYILRQQFEQQLHPESKIGTYLGDINLNLFSGYLQIEGLEYKPKGETLIKLGHLEIKISPLALLQGKVVIEDARATLGYWRVERLAGGTMDFSLPRFSTETAPVNSVETKAKSLALWLEHLVIKQITIDYRDQKTKTEFKLNNVSIAKFDLSGSAAPAKFHADIAWGKTHLETSGEFSLEGTKPQYEGELLIKDLAIENALGLVHQEKTIEGILSTNLDVSFKQQLTTSGAVEINNFSMSQSDLTLESQTIKFNHLEVRLNLDELDEASAKVTGLVFDEIKVKQSALSADSAQLLQLKVESFELKNKAVFLTELELKELALDGNTRLALATIDIVNASELLVELGEVNFSGLNVLLLRNKKGTWQLPINTGAKREAATTSPTAPMAWKLAGINFVENNIVTIDDKSLKPAFKQRIILEELSLGTLSSQSPNADTVLTLKLKPDEYSLLSIQGKSRPLAEPLYLDAEGSLTGLSLVSLNGLLKKDLGHHFLKGQLDNSFQIKINKNKLDMSNKLELFGLDVEAIPDAGGPPLSLAVALLEDTHGRFELEVPIKGDLSNPNFHVLAALNPIIIKSVAGAAALAIQPLGSVLLVGSLLANNALKVSFEPALFEAKGLRLEKGVIKKLELLAEKLSAKPKLALRLCGVVALADRALDKKTAKFIEPEPALLSLAQQRAGKVHQVLRDAGVPKKQLKTCRPSIDVKQKGLPRVEIRL